MHKFFAYLCTGLAGYFLGCLIWASWAVQNNNVVAENFWQTNALLFVIFLFISLLTVMSYLTSNKY